MEEDEERQFQLLSKKRQEHLRGIIVVMGLPSTWKTSLSCLIGEWAKCPALCIQHFLDGNDKKAVADAVAGAGAGAGAVEEDIQERDDRRRQLLVQRAFPRLCNVAKFHLSSLFNGNATVVIKSRLKSTFELDQLIELVTSTDTRSCEKYPLLIIDCRFTNMFRWKKSFESHYIYDAPDIEDEVTRSWYRLASWNEMEDLIARDHDYQAAWDHHLQQLLHKAPHRAPIVVRRLVLDPCNDLTVNGVLEDFYLSNDFSDAIKYLLTSPRQDLIDIFKNPHTVEYRELRPYLLEKRWSAVESRGRRKYLCPGGDCVFKYSDNNDEAASASASASSNLTYCGVCEKQLVLGMPTYTCRKCSLTLHKSCAERVDLKALKPDIQHLSNYYHRDNLPHKYACKPCLNAGKDFNDGCGSCLFQTHLKCVPLPTIINHDSHPHFLSLYLFRITYHCTACGTYSYDISYNCYKCNSFYHLECALLPLELLKHKHGGHEHVMKLMYSLHEDGMEQEEVYWCEVCYEDMDPEACCYSCQNCPYYVTHVWCAGGFEFLHNPKDVKLVQQLQPQLEDAFPEIFRAGRNGE